MVTLEPKAYLFLSKSLSKIWLANGLPRSLLVGQGRRKSYLPERKIYLSRMTGRGFFRAQTKGVILFLLWRTFVVPSLKNTVSIFPEIKYRLFWISIFHFLVENNMTSSVINLRNRKMSISLKRKQIFWKAFHILSTNYFSLHMHFK